MDAGSLLEGLLSLDESQLAAISTKDHLPKVSTVIHDLYLTEEMSYERLRRLRVSESGGRLLDVLC
jgi:hypothetical protein